MREPTSMALATADAEGRPSVRMVLLKGLASDGFRFFTNYESRKGRDLAANPQAALCLWWDRLERQVRAEGRVERLSREDSERYFRSRPRGSQIGASASPQSRPLADRFELEKRVAELEARHPEEDLPLPDFWGGYLLIPERVELWQGRESRLHDRFEYRREGAGWRIVRLAP
jgi:pyridoxamine 5'-phosphate oxidase